MPVLSLQQVSRSLFCSVLNSHPWKPSFLFRKQQWQVFRCYLLTSGGDQYDFLWITMEAGCSCVKTKNICQWLIKILGGNLWRAASVLSHTGDLWEVIILLPLYYNLYLMHQRQVFGEKVLWTTSRWAQPRSWRLGKTWWRWWSLPPSW